MLPLAWDRAGQQAGLKPQGGVWVCNPEADYAASRWSDVTALSLLCDNSGRLLSPFDFVGVMKFACEWLWTTLPCYRICNSNSAMERCVEADVGFSGIVEACQTLC